MTLLDGRQIDQSVVYFNKANYTFQGPDGEDLTSQITRADKLKFSGFDPEVDNERLYQKQYQATHGGSPAPRPVTTSTAELFVEGVTSDIRNIGEAVTKPVQTAASSLLVIAGLLGALWIFLNKKK